MAVMSDLVAVVITSIENYPVLTLFPESLHLQDSIFVAFNQSGPGHCDATVDLSESINPGSDLPVLGEGDEVPNKNFLSRDVTTYCRCGENSTDHNKVSCTDVERKTRCPCYKLVKNVQQSAAAVIATTAKPKVLLYLGVLKE